MPWFHELRALADDSGKQLTFVDRTGTPMEFVNLAEPNEPFTRRLAACWNVCMGIPTETLEAGVVVVPVEEYEALVGYAEELDEIESRMGNYSEQRAAIIRTANTRLQQNGGEGR